MADNFNGLICYIALRTINSSSSGESSDSDEDILMIRKSHVKIEEYVRNTVLKYNPSDFKSHFRLSRTAVEDLCLELSFPNNLTPGRPPTRPVDALLLTLWSLATQESFRELGDRFGVSRGNAHTIFIKVCQLICKLKERYFIWPTGAALMKTVNDFNQLRGNISFPNVVGCVDGTHIRIRGPTTDNSYYNRKGYNSMILQGIVNSKQEFLDVFCGWPGSAHDARVWQNSPIYQRIQNENLIPEEYHLLGDTAYPLKSFIMVPFKDNGHLTRQQKYYNRVLSSSRVVIEQSFGRLKEVFRRLQYINLVKLEYFKFIVVAACLLHNFSIAHKEYYDLDFDIPIEDDNDELQDDAQDQHGDRLARNKRERIMLTLR